MTPHSLFQSRSNPHEGAFWQPKRSQLQLGELGERSQSQTPLLKSTSVGITDAKLSQEYVQLRESIRRACSSGT